MARPDRFYGCLDLMVSRDAVFQGVFLNQATSKNFLIETSFLLLAL
ncbi:hypothetical protein CEV34_3462 [Brucella pseudogrignonensis]|uniref:Uncharacterized protein n=1 Tax=Brucella pseudogrignonensis TaxID=419475 RepID=A0A256G8S6_9HYPH|nr:hypothetical protein CEV34_3462 [Brucella pseudogrignonensis]